MVVKESQPSGGDCDSIVCYCFAKTLGELQGCYRRLGSLAAVQQETHVGSKCGGCRLILESTFGEQPDEILSLRGDVSGNSRALVRPGQTVMKGFIVADQRLDSVVRSSNGVPPQFGSQDTTIPIEYMLLDQSGNKVLHRAALVRSHDTFTFDTRRENLPRPLYGMFILALGRGNYGASRFNVAWTNGASICSTHEVSSSGRPIVVMPVMVDEEFLRGPNTIFLAAQNPHHVPINVVFRFFDDAGNGAGEMPLTLAPASTRWIDANRELYGPALRRRPGSRLGLKIVREPLTMDTAPTLYFFMHNANSGLWTANHL